MTATMERGELHQASEPQPSAWRRLARLVTGTLSTLWTAVIVWWLATFWPMIADASSVISRLDGEFGGSFLDGAWPRGVAHEIFLLGRGDPSTNHIGRTIDAGMAYWPLIGIAMVFMVFTGAILSGLNLATGSRALRWLSAVMGVLFIASLIPLFKYGYEIDQLTVITE